jgi:4-hydroxy-tetrahydrodipicolinate synthase
MRGEAMEFRGAYTALVTPFRDGAVDFDAFRRLLETQKAAGLAGVVPCGCTGEAATLSRDERRKLLDIALETVGNDMSVIPGTGSNSTEISIELTREAEEAGAHGAMLISPYYNKPSQTGLVEHYRRIADATSLPLVLYNVPGRTGVTISPETVATLFATGRFGALKEAGGSVDAVSDLKAASGITILSGDDSLTVAMIAIGAKGVVSVVSNLYPGAVKKMVDAALKGDFGRASAYHYKVLPVVRAAFCESNPSPIKAMLEVKGLIANELRSPLAPIGKQSNAIILDALERTRELGGE